MIVSSSSLLLILISAGFGWYIRSWWYARTAGSAAYVLVYDGLDLKAGAGKVTSNGVKLGAAEYPAGTYTKVRSPDGRLFAVVGIEHIALVEHEALERMRFGLLLSSVFKPGGDWMEWLRIASVVATLGAALYVSSSVSSLWTVVNSQTVESKRMADILSKPLVVAAPEPTKGIPGE